MQMNAQIKDSGIQFHPRKGSVLICDFSGNKIPEIVKKRPVVVLTPRLPYRDGLAIVVPLSTTPPKHKVPYVAELSENYLGNKDKMYAKCDLLCSVSFQRLDRIKVGYRKYDTPKMSDEDFIKVIKGVKSALGFDVDI